MSSFSSNYLFMVLWVLYFFFVDFILLFFFFAIKNNYATIRFFYILLVLSLKWNKTLTLFFCETWILMNFIKQLIRNFNWHRKKLFFLYLFTEFILNQEFFLNTRKIFGISLKVHPFHPTVEIQLIKTVLNDWKLRIYNWLKRVSFFFVVW